jgi:hypothetical protein
MNRPPSPVKGALSGYRLSDLAGDRRKVLEKKISKEGYSTVIRKLNVVAILNKETQPQNHKKIRGDMSYLKKHRGEYKEPMKKEKK